MTNSANPLSFDILAEIDCKRPEVYGFRSEMNKLALKCVKIMLA